ncbi:MAG: tRNA (adenosine(37)-N6)-threonylcarbamoyltransferase complex ATPase subunit type 1 TsaE [Gammaproteobacteria bacterium]
MREHQPLNLWLADDQQTRQAGAALAAALVPFAQSEPLVIFVRGDLGAGKSTLVRGFLSRAGVRGVMPSPTYSLVEPYQTDSLKIFHMDAYRLADAAELDYLGLDDIDAPGSILLVEWPDHIRNALPKPALTVDLAMAARPEEGQFISVSSCASAESASVQVEPASGSAAAESVKAPGMRPVGRTLIVSVSGEPVDLYECLEASEEWEGLFRVVT